MTNYMIQFRYGQGNIKALIQEPGNRTEMVRQGVESFGGRLRSFYYAFGEYDGVVLAEFPNSESCTAFLMMVTSKGGAAAFKTTVLIDPDEAVRAMQRAGSTATGYRPATT